MSEEIRQALMALPLKHGADAKIDAEVNRLLLVAGVLAPIADQTFSKSASPATAECEIVKLGELASKLGLHLRRMHGNSLAAVERADGGRHPFAIEDRLGELIQACNDAVSDIHNEGTTETKATASSIAKAAYRTFQRLTGRRPTVIGNDGTAYGPFLDLLNGLFNAFGVKASAESQARKVIDYFAHIDAKKPVD